MESEERRVSPRHLYGYVGNNPVNFVDPYGLFGLQEIGDFSAGFGDTLTSGFGLTDLFDLPSLTEYIRGQMGTDVYVNKCSGSYTGGEVAGEIWGVAAGSAGVARSAGWTSKIAAHGPHHSFGKLGKLSHIQTTIWKKGVKRSGKNIRIPLPWR